MKTPVILPVKAIPYKGFVKQFKNLQNADKTLDNLTII